MIADNLVGHGFQSPQAMSLTHDSNIFFPPGIYGQMGLWRGAGEWRREGLQEIAE